MFTPLLGFPVIVFLVNYVILLSHHHNVLALYYRVDNKVIRKVGPLQTCELSLELETGYLPNSDKTTDNSVLSICSYSIIIINIYFFNLVY